MLRGFRTLRRKGVIGINERNIRYVNELNPRRLIHLVDDKLETKRVALEADIATPEVYGVVRNARDMSSAIDVLDKPNGFVVKPAMGSQGKGILVVDSPLSGGWRLASGRRIKLDALKFHMNNILSGMYSLGGQPDKVMIEYRVEFDDVFADISFKGVPDIRVIVVNGFPIFAMLRLPTAESDGKANLHKGGVGVGLDMMSGKTRFAMHRDTLIETHPDTAHNLTDIQTPYWDTIMSMASRAYSVTGLGYLGVDIVLDKTRGPLLLELNARPGISIQIANRTGMRSALEAAMRIDGNKLTADERVEFALNIYEECYQDVSSPA